MQIKFFAAAIISTSVHAANVQTDSSVISVQDDIPTPIVAILTKDSIAAPSLSDTCSLYSDSKWLKAGSPVVIIAKRECKSRYNPEPTSNYEVVVSGKRLFVDASAITLSPTESDKVKELSIESREQYFENAALLSRELRLYEVKNLLKFIETTRKAGLTIIKSSIEDVSEYTEGTSFSVTVSNPTDKTIKYIWFTVVGYNPVQDPVKDVFKGGPALTVRAVGPIKKYETSGYKWDYMWHTNIVRSFKIKEIKVQYMDNSTRIIRDWRSISLSPENRRIFEEGE